jgi:3-dehydroquinate dehydratase-2
METDLLPAAQFVHSVWYNVLMRKKLYLLNGPNLNLLGDREPSVYGVQNLASVEHLISEALAADSSAAEAGAEEFEVDARQTNSEAELIEWIHGIYAANSDAHKDLGVILNPGAFTHYSYGLRDALALLHQIGVRVIEVHISNPHAREEFRHNSVVSPVVTGTIAGLGVHGYELALNYLRKAYNE